MCDLKGVQFLGSEGCPAILSRRFGGIGNESNGNLSIHCRFAAYGGLYIANTHIYIYRGHNFLSPEKLVRCV